MKKLIILKLGGSLITDKNTPYTLRPQEITHLVTQIKRAHQEFDSNTCLMIGNGAGSFAHHSAKTYHTKDGFQDETGKLGACITHFDAIKLNQILIETYLEAKLPVFSFQPSAYITTSAKAITPPLFLNQISAALTKGLIPSFYGDVMIDTELGSSIVSTDTLCALFAKEFQKKQYEVRVIHAGDYDGVLDQNGHVIGTISQENAHTFTHIYHASEHIDVTGGMKIKVEEMLKLAHEGIQSLIIRGNKDSLLYDALSGKTTSGTLITS